MWWWMRLPVNICLLLIIAPWHKTILDMFENIETAHGHWWFDGLKFPQLLTSMDEARIIADKNRNNFIITKFFRVQKQTEDQSPNVK